MRVRTRRSVMMMTMTLTMMTEVVVTVTAAHELAKAFACLARPREAPGRSP